VKLTEANAEIWVPDGASEAPALERVTHLGISAHQDDIEIMAMEGILAGFGNPEKWFMAVIVTNGAGSPRNGLYADYTDQQMRVVRRAEQKKAALVGEYSAVAFLDFASAAVKSPGNPGPKNDLRALIATTRPEVIYTHSLADKHDTHVSVGLRTIAAIRELPPQDRPRRLYGCEVWRDLDWLSDADKTVFDLSRHENLQASLVGVFDSQIVGGKRYDLATLARRRAHATYHESHSVDAAQLINFAMDLTPLIEDETLDPAEYVSGFVQRFAEDVNGRIKRFA
jgi:LmbE family N-acetylglucosaminyl deacetylase